MPIEVDIDNNAAIDIEYGGTNAKTVEGAKLNFGLDQVDNTADLDKPISTATQTALDSKLETVAVDATLTGDGTSGNPLSVVPNPGIDGTDGVDGRTILSGTVNPDAGVGADGDFYINTSTKYIFGPKATTWPIGVSLIGPAGADGQAGADGADGDSAYQIAVNAGFVGTEQEWLDSLVGAPGADGADGADGAGVALVAYKTASFSGAATDFCEVISSDTGIDFAWDEGTRTGTFTRPGGELIQSATIRLNNAATSNFNIVFNPGATDASTRIPNIEIYDTVNNQFVTSSTTIRMGFPARVYDKLTLIGLSANDLIIKLTNF